MSLDWDCNQCDKPEAANDEEAAARKCLVFESLCVNLDCISEDNEQEWMFRSMLLQKVDLSSIMYGTDDWDAKAKFLWESLRRWRGMTTNAPRKSRKEWLAVSVGLIEKEVLRQLPTEDEVFGVKENA